MAIAESRLKVDIRESITLNNNKYDSFNSVTLYNISEVAKRIVTLPIGNSGSSSSPEKEIITISGSIGSGTYLEGDVRYMRFTNLSPFNPIIMEFQNEDSDSFVTKIGQGLSFIYSGASGSGVINTMDASSGSFGPIDINLSNYAGLGDLTTITAKASGSSNEYTGDTSGSVHNVDMEIFVAAV